MPSKCTKCGFMFSTHESPSDKLCEGCYYDALGNIVEEHPIGGHLRGRGSAIAPDSKPSVTCDNCGTNKIAETYICEKCASPPKVAFMQHLLECARCSDVRTRLFMSGQAGYDWKTLAAIFCEEGRGLILRLRQEVLGDERDALHALYQSRGV